MLGRRCCYSHHIIAPAKREASSLLVSASARQSSLPPGGDAVGASANRRRQAVMQWALQLGLSGLSKIGWPGVVIVEGPEAGCVAAVAPAVVAIAS